jgi:uncharacterized membrane protein (UPF0127 family)
MRSSGFLQPVVDHPGSGWALRIADTGAVLVRRLETAFDSASRRRGLLGRDGLPDDTALVIAPSNAVHTFFMRFPIDVVFAARDGRVLKVRTGIGRRRMSAALGAFAVIETAAGVVGRSGLRRGSKLEIAPTESEHF